MYRVITDHGEVSIMAVRQADTDTASQTERQADRQIKNLTYIYQNYSEQ